jgi:hypothetical protein
MIHIKLSSLVSCTVILSACAQPAAEIIPEPTFNKLGELTSNGTCAGGGQAGGADCLPPPNTNQGGGQGQGQGQGQGNP